MPWQASRAVERLRIRFAKLHTAPMSTFAWDDLRYFLAFARAGSMQAAATALGVNQSTVQRRIAELEERVGHRLVERHLGSYRLTELGEELRPRSRASRQQWRHSSVISPRATKVSHGIVRLTCGSSIWRVASDGRHLSTPFMHAILDCGSSWLSATGFLICPRERPISRSDSANPGTKPSSVARSPMLPGLCMPAVPMSNGMVGRTSRKT